MKNVLLCLFIILVSSCVKSPVEPDSPTGGTPPTKEGEGNFSTRGKLEWTGSIAMEDGPHDLLVHDTRLFAVRDHRLFWFDISRPAQPALQQTYALGNGAARFGKLHVADDKLYVTCQTDGLLYTFSNKLELLATHELAIPAFKPNVVLKDKDGNWWVGGSNGSRGILATYTLVDGQLKLSAHWVAAGNDSNIESMVERDNYIIASIPKGELLSFRKSDLASGVANSITYQHESGHEKWGHTIIAHGSKAYWANWGAGFATVDIADPANLELSEILTNSGFKSQFAAAEGTNVYDVVYNAKHDLLCIANGWSGVVLVKPASPGKVVDFIDPEYFQNRCIETSGDYIYTGNISGGMSGDLKGIKVFRIK